MSLLKKLVLGGAAAGLVTLSSTLFFRGLNILAEGRKIDIDGIVKHNGAEARRYELLKKYDSIYGEKAIESYVSNRDFAVQYDSLQAEIKQIRESDEYKTALVNQERVVDNNARGLCYIGGMFFLVPALPIVTTLTKRKKKKGSQSVALSL